MIKTKTYILFGTFNDRMNPAIAIEAIEKLGKSKTDQIFFISFSFFVFVFFFCSGDYFKAKEAQQQAAAAAAAPKK